jgi:hypothetical protein
MQRIGKFVLGCVLACGALFGKEKGMDATDQVGVKDLTMQFAQLFTAKNAEGIGALLAEEFAFCDPALKWVRGKERVLEVLKKQFGETENVSYEVVNVYTQGNVGILEFKITLDDLVLEGVDFMEWSDGQMTELRCYYNSPHREELKPFSALSKSFAEGSIYEHYKGKRYKILAVSRHSESLDECVVYQAQYGNRDVWVRPVAMFSETIEIEGRVVPRFKRVE